MTTARTTMQLAWREIAIEARGRESLGWLLPVTASIIVLVGLGAGPDPRLLQQLAPVAVWLVAVLAAALLGVSSVRAERDDGCWDLLRALVSPGELLVGKIAGVGLQLLLAWLVAAAGAALALQMPLSVFGIAGGIVGTWGLAPVAVLVGVAVGDVTRRVGLALVLLLPLGLPPALAGAQLIADPQPRWLLLMSAYALLSWAVAWTTFPMLSEE